MTKEKIRSFSAANGKAISTSALLSPRDQALVNGSGSKGDGVYTLYETMAMRVKELETEIARNEIIQEMQKQEWRDQIKDLEDTVRYLQEEKKKIHVRHQVIEQQEGDLDSKSQALEGLSIDPLIELDKEEWGKAEEEVGMKTVKVLNSDQVERYSRQLLMSDGFGVEGQCKLLSSSVLVIGAGGIGSTVLLYLAASGVGRISVVDMDEVDKSNLHRQVIHKDSSIGVHKTDSACQAVHDLNPSIQCLPVREELTHENALDLVSRHDCIVDASDNPRTRYLLNDACVLANKPLISGSAMGTEGQLTVYNHKEGGCYRCLYPKPDEGEGCKSCSDNGVLGPVPGLIGILQAVEVLKLLTGSGTTMHNRLIMYDSLGCSFLSIKKPPRLLKCPVCGPNATITSMKESQEITKKARGPTEIVEGGKRVCLHPVPNLPEELLISCADYAKIRNDNKPHVLLDVRAPRQFEMCSLDGALNIPLEKLKEELGLLGELSETGKSIYCICRRGIFSAEATRMLNEIAEYNPSIHSVRNIQGGLEAWSSEVDSSFPLY